MDGSGSRRRLLVVYRSGIQEVLKLEEEAIAYAHAEYDRARAFTLTELNVASREWRPGSLWNHITSKREYHPLRLNRSEAIPKEDLIERNDIGGDRALANRRLRPCARSSSQENQA